jgi:D-alanyl-D-alanine endopeptidase (penicillin-binding protein 7)
MLRTILAVSLLLTCSVGKAAVAFHSAHVMVVDETSGKVLLKKDIDAAAPIASLTKLMTAMVVLDAQQDPNEDLRIDIADTDDLKHSRGGVPVGAVVSRGSLLELALLASDNRAASALARSYPGGLPAFDAAMQRKIHALGLNSTSIVEPTGLSPSNISSAQDLIRILRAAARYPVIAQITSLRSHIVLVNGRTRIVRNTNRLVGGPEWQVLLSKTGFTNEAGRCLGMWARADGRTVTVVLIGAPRPSRLARDATTIRRWLDAGRPTVVAHSAGQRPAAVVVPSRSAALELDRRRADGGTTETAAAVVEPSIGKPAEEGTTESAAAPKAN